MKFLPHTFLKYESRCKRFKNRKLYLSYKCARHLEVLLKALWKLLYNMKNYAIVS